MAKKYEAFDLIEVSKIDVASLIYEFKLNEALVVIWKVLAEGDKYINDEKPWESGDVKTISKAVSILKEVALTLKPFLPEASELILEAINNKTNLERLLFPRLN